jgi:nitroimidazol reductase NimA-like FMN-containing flavoprotein (pyridoxamine 5'-phosphate oxidase superfamily)
MFRGLTRKKQEISFAECEEILEKERRGVLSVLGEQGYPYGMPMNHYYEKEEGVIYFHCGRGGHRYDAIREHDRVSLCVYEQGSPCSDHWALSVRSVIVFGRIEVMEDREQIERITYRLSRRFTDDEEYIQNEIRQYAKGTLLLKLTPTHICGKRVKEC